jgi:hypothetical protein
MGKAGTLLWMSPFFIDFPGSVRPDGYPCGEEILFAVLTLVSGTFVEDSGTLVVIRLFPTHPDV